MLIDCSYFTAGPRHIQNASLGKIPNADAVIVNEAIEEYIASYQERFLTRVLGATLGNKINAYLVCLDEDQTPKHHEALDAVCDQLKESFADYVFYHIIRENNTQATMTGLVRLKCANEYVAPIRRQVMTWNRMVDRNRQFEKWSRSAECPVTGISVSDSMLTKINTFNL